jgi:hypothetical protein
MCKKLKILLASLWLISLLPLAAQNEHAGTTGFDTLKLYYNARTTAMAGAVNGIPKNADALDFNPAAILDAPNRSVATTFMDHLVGSGGGSISYVLPKNRFVAWGAGLRYWNSGSIDRTEISSTGELIETGESFGAHSLMASVSTARFISPVLDLGGSLKFIYDTIDDASASAVMIDLGILHHTVNERIKVGLSARNIGFQSSYYSSAKHSEKLPSTYSAGISMQLNDQLMGAIDLSKANGENFVARLGVEHQLNPALALRGGFKSNAGDYYMGGILAYTSGLSLGLGWNVKDFDLDYAVASYGDLGISNQLTLRYNY